MIYPRIGYASRRKQPAEEVPVEPLKETEEALWELMEPDESEWGDVLTELGRRARAIVPECVGLSLGLVHEGLTLTLVASREEIAEIDAVQYVDGGPCVVEDPERHEARAEAAVMSDLLDEQRWTMFAQASAAAGIASSLSLTVTTDDGVVGGINLYASTVDAFAGRHEELERALGATAGSAVRDADLTFATRRSAVDAPEQLRDQRHIDVALGMLAARYGESIEDAGARLSSAAERAGLVEAKVARLLVLLHRR
jgi:GAF domain-containing protein